MRELRPEEYKSDVFTVGQVAAMLKVSKSPIIRLFDSGKIRGYRIPGSQDRRIPREYLIMFLRKNRVSLGIVAQKALEKLGAQNNQKKRLLVVTQDKEIATGVALAFHRNCFFEAAIVPSAFEAGLEFAEHRPDCTVIDLAIGQDEALLVLNKLDDAKSVNVIALLPFAESEVAVKRYPQIHGCMVKPFPTHKLVAKIDTLFFEQAKEV